MSLSSKRNGLTVRNTKKENAAEAVIIELSVISDLYAGLGDNRGSITRYEREGALLPSREYMKEYLRNGGTLDSCGVWGYTPQDVQKFESRLIPASFLATVAKLFGRTDFVNIDTCILLEDTGIEITKQNYVLFEKGQKTRELLKTFGIEVPNDNIGLGWWKPSKLLKIIANNMSLAVNARLMYTMLNNEFKIEEDLKPIKGNHFWKKFLSDYQKWENRQNMPNRWGAGMPPFAVFSKHTAMKTVEYTYGHYGVSRCTSITPGRITNEFLFKGEKVLTEPGTFVFSSRTGPIKNVLVKSHKMGIFWGMKLKSTYLMWPQGQDFSTHVEGDSFQSCIEKLKSRTKLQNYEICLEQVRNDKKETAMFCLSGVKAFAKERMPFLHRQIVSYKQWEEIPIEIMKQEFCLTGSELFQGYPNPVK